MRTENLQNTPGSARKSTSKKSGLLQIFMQCTGRLFALYLVLVSLPTTGKTQTTISSYDISFAVSSSTPMSVAYHPGYARYYVASGGSSSSPMYVFNSSGSYISNAAAAFDNRGLWYNPSNSRIEGNNYSGSAYGYYPLTGTGDMNGNVVSFATGTVSPGSQLGGVLNTTTSEILFFNGTAVYRYSLAGASLGTISITAPAGVSFNSTHMIYTGSSDNKIGFYDPTNKRVYLYPITGGTYSLYYNLPSSAPAASSYGFAFANNHIFVSSGSSIWYGYPLTIPAPAISSFAATSAPTGATVTITGTNLTGATAVSFGGTNATSFTVVNATTITAVVAAGTSGSVSVTTPGGTATKTGFIYVAKPTTQASAIDFAGTTATQTTVSWTNGNGSSRAVFIKATNTGTAAPVNATTYTASTTFGAGTQIASSGWYCVYNGTGTSVTVTGLSASTTYRAMTIDYNGSAGSEGYATATGTDNPDNVTTAALPAISSFTPTNAGIGQTVTITGTNFTNASAISFGGTAATSFTVVSATSITAVVGSGSNGVVSVTTPMGSATLAGFTISPTWLGTVSSAWNNASNWSPAAIPVSGNIFVSPTAPNALQLNTNYSMSVISFTAGSPNIVLGNYTLTATNISGAGSDHYIKTNDVGKLKINVANGSSVLFPVGNSAYNPVTITNNSGSANDFSVLVMDEVYKNGVAGPTVNSPRVTRTWDITKATANGGSGIDFVFNWNSGEKLDITAARLYHYQSGAWAKQTGTTSSTATSLTYTGYLGTFSPFSIGDDLVILPLTWLSFTAQKQNDNVVLNWQTDHEQNTKDFIVQRSTDGAAWSAIGTVHANGSGGSYRFTDETAVTGINFYRIQQRDQDNHSSYSAIVKIVSGDGTEALRILGNPVKNNKLIVSLKETQTLSLLSTDGKLIWKNKLSAGIQQIDVSRFAEGTYILKSSGSSTKVMISKN